MIFMISIMVKSCLKTNLCWVCSCVSETTREAGSPTSGLPAGRAGRVSHGHRAGTPGPRRGASPNRRAGLRLQAGSFPGAVTKRDARLCQGTEVIFLQHLESHLCCRKCCLSFPSLSAISSHLPTVQIQLLSPPVRKTW